MKKKLLKNTNKCQLLTELSNAFIMTGQTNPNTSPTTAMTPPNPKRHVLAQHPLTEWDLKDSVVLNVGLEHKNFKNTLSISN